MNPRPHPASRAQGLFSFDERVPEDTSVAEKVWRTTSERAGSFISLATSRWQLVVWSHGGRTHITVRGPETRATITPAPANAEYVGIVFRLGTVLTPLSEGPLVDSAFTMPEASPGRFWLDGSSCDVPDYESADTFVAVLKRKGLLARDETLGATGLGRGKAQSLRSTQRSFVRATGLTMTLVRQIERARDATMLLQRGTSITDTTHELGYFDQAHLTRSLKRFIGRTPGQVLKGDESDQLSFLYKRSLLS